MQDVQVCNANTDDRYSSQGKDLRSPGKEILLIWDTHLLGPLEKPVHDPPALGVMTHHLRNIGVNQQYLKLGNRMSSLSRMYWEKVETFNHVCLKPARKALNLSIGNLQSSPGIVCTCSKARLALACILRSMGMPCSFEQQNLSFHLITKKANQVSSP